MALRTGQTYTAALFTPADPAPWPGYDQDRVVVPGTVELQSGSNQISVTVEASKTAELTAFKASLDSFDSESGYRGIPLSLFISAADTGGDNIRESLWTIAVTFNETDATKATIYLNQQIDTDEAAGTGVTAEAYVITSPLRVDSDNVRQANLPTRRRPLEEDDPDEETVTLYVTDVRGDLNGTLYSGYFFATSEVTDTTVLRVTVGEDQTEEYGLAQFRVSAGNTKPRWDVVLGDEETLANLRPVVALQQQVVPPATSPTGFIQVQLVGKRLAFHPSEPDHGGCRPADCLRQLHYGHFGGRGHG